MGDITFVLLLVSSFLVVMFWENVRRYLFYVMKVCHNGAGGLCGCSSSRLPSSSFSEEHQWRTRYTSRLDEISEKKSNKTMDNKTIDKMSYFLAFNDENTAIECNATPLQDVDPKDFA
ncbi:MAG: hypothetical protein LBD81_03760 [Holosporaceae bacterium]|jgi:hypothetical protein|nr:hypothetical protein [Holosporaceae bacterium]